MPCYDGPRKQPAWEVDEQVRRARAELRRLKKHHREVELILERVLANKLPKAEARRLYRDAGRAFAKSSPRGT